MPMISDYFRYIQLAKRLKYIICSNQLAIIISFLSVSVVITFASGCPHKANIIIIVKWC